MSDSLRIRLTLLASLAVAFVLGLSSLAVVQIQRSVLATSIEESLSQRADNLRPAVTGAVSSLPSEGDQEDSFLQLLGPDGRVLAASANVAGLPAVARTRGLHTVAVHTLSSHKYRVLVRAVGDRSLVVAKNVDDVQDSLRILAISLLVAVPTATLLLAALLWWLVGRVLRPVEAIRTRVASIGADQLGQRVPVPSGDDEISRLARTMNGMLERVQVAAERQQQFVADASHELRSPLSRLRSTVDVALTHPALEPTRTTLEAVASDVHALQDLVSDLLFLSRAEAGNLPAEPVDLDDLVLDAAAALRSQGVPVDTTAVSAARTRGDARQLARVLANLGDNAARHTSSVVRFALREDGGSCELVVADDGPGVAEEHRTSIFDRFTRLDDARSRDGGGSGLGLAIVHDIVQRHRGSVTVHAATPTGAEFVVRLPREG